MKTTMILFFLVVLVLGASGAWALTLYGPDADYNHLMQVEQPGDEPASPQAVVDELAQIGAVPQGVRVISMVDEGGTARLNLSQEFGDAMNATGTSGEALMMGSLVNTFLAHYALDSLLVTCEGRQIETGHSVYDEPLSRYPTGSVAFVLLEGTGWTLRVDGMEMRATSDVTGGMTTFVLEAASAGQATLAFEGPQGQVRGYGATAADDGSLWLVPTD